MPYLFEKILFYHSLQKCSLVKCIDKWRNTKMTHITVELQPLTYKLNASQGRIVFHHPIPRAVIDGRDAIKGLLNYAIL